MRTERRSQEGGSEPGGGPGARLLPGGSNVEC